MQFNRIFSAALAAGIVLATVACQKVDEISSKSAQTSEKSLTVTATIADIDGTKVSYSFDENNAQKAIKQMWEGEDQIFGFDDKGGTFTFEVKSVKEGVATFEFAQNGNNIAQEAATLYAVYYPGKTVEMINNKTLDVDLTANNGVLNGDGDTKAPVIMCATASIANGKVDFKFINQTAIVGIYKMQIIDGGKPVAAGTQISSVTLNGVYTSGVIKLDGENFGLVAKTESTSSITASVSLSTAAKGHIDANTTGEGAINAYFSVIPESYDNITVTAAKDEKTYSTTGSISGSLSAGTYYYIGKRIYGGTVAKISETGKEYATISEAFADATNEQTIQLQNDCEFDSQITLADKTGTITLDLNGKTLTNGLTSESKIRRIYLNSENATLVIKDSKNDGGKITGPVDQDIVKVIKGNLTVASGTIEAPSGGTDGENAAIWVEPATKGATTSASLTVQGTADIKGPASFAEGVTGKRAYALYVDNPGAAISVEGGKFSAQSNSMRIMDAASVDITGGKFTTTAEGEYTLRFAGGYVCNIGQTASVSSNKASAVYLYSSSSATDFVTLNVTGGTYKNINPESNAILGRTKSSSKIYVTGGLFNKNVSEDYVVSGYSCTNNLDDKTKDEYQYVVKMEEETPAVSLKIGTGDDNNYPSLEAAVSIANTTREACTIKLLQDDVSVETAINVTNTNGITLDLNGKTLAQDGSTKRIGVEGNGLLTITDEEGNGKVIQKSASNIFNISAGKLVLAGGEIYQEKAATAIFQDGGELSIEGGKINVEANNYALQANSGIVTISNGEIISKGSYTIYVNNTSTKVLDVDITGGVIKSEKGDPTESNAHYIIYINAITENSSFDITGGQFKSNNRFVYSKNDTGASVEISNGTSSYPYFYTYNTTGTTNSPLKPFLKQSSSASPIILGGGYYGCTSETGEWAINNCSYAPGKTSKICTHTGPDGLEYKRWVTDKQN